MPCSSSWANTLSIWPHPCPDGGPLHQKTYIHRPQTKIVESVTILAGLPHLEDIRRDGRPLDQDHIVATAWQQTGWADYSGVGRTLQALTQAEAEAIGRVLQAMSQPLIDEQITQTLAAQGRLIYDGDLTGRPVSNTSTTYPEAAFGHMDDDVRLGYQAAVVSVGSPTYGRLWLAVKPHPGNLVSCLLAEELVLAAEAATGVRPWRRTDLLRHRWQALCAQRNQAEQRLAQRRVDLAAAQAVLQASVQNGCRRLKRPWRRWSATTRRGSDRSDRTANLPKRASRPRLASVSTPARPRAWHTLTKQVARHQDARHPDPGSGSRVACTLAAF